MLPQPGGERQPGGQVQGVQPVVDRGAVPAIWPKPAGVVFFGIWPHTDGPREETTYFVPDGRFGAARRLPLGPAVREVVRRGCPAGENHVTVCMGGAPSVEEGIARHTLRGRTGCRRAPPWGRRSPAG